MKNRDLNLTILNETIMICAICWVVAGFVLLCKSAGASVPFFCAALSVVHLGSVLRRCPEYARSKLEARRGH